ncbi:MAG: hypothetical protein J3K34DRAFT_125111 [Monoraphidium minutum]|nr:MAG: hypothetical protein J3K34DRAFT_125111 [Monoraphidium minutum]
MHQTTRRQPPAGNHPCPWPPAPPPAPLHNSRAPATDMEGDCAYASPFLLPPTRSLSLDALVLALDTSPAPATCGAALRAAAAPPPLASVVSGASDESCSSALCRGASPHPPAAAAAPPPCGFCGVGSEQLSIWVERLLAADSNMSLSALSPALSPAPTLAPAAAPRRTPPHSPCAAAAPAAAAAALCSGAAAAAGAPAGGGCGGEGWQVLFAIKLPDPVDSRDSPFAFVTRW